MARRKLSWTKRNLKKAKQVSLIMEELSDYLPLTLRQIYYRLVTGRTFNFAVCPQSDRSANDALIFPFKKFSLEGELLNRAKEGSFRADARKKNYFSLIGEPMQAGCDTNSLRNKK
jgi:hypothetical protein